MPQARTIDCPKCGAPLTASAGSTTCPFCGTVSTIHAEAAAAKEEGATHIVSLVSPLWLTAWAKSASLLWPHDAANIVVLPFADPYDKADRLPCLHLALADRLAVETHVLVQSMVATTGGRVVPVFNEPLGTYAGIAHWAQKFTPS